MSFQIDRFPFYVSFRPLPAGELRVDKRENDGKQYTGAAIMLIGEVLI